MSRFYLTAVNSRGSVVTAAGSSRGQDAHLRGWNAGVEVFAKPKPLDEKRDCFPVYATGGSNNGNRWHLGDLIEKEDGSLVFRLSDELAGRIDPAFRTAELRPPR